MKRFFKQLFCFHMWVRTAAASEGSVHAAINVGGQVTIERYYKDIVSYRCCKCYKEKTEEELTPVIQ